METRAALVVGASSDIGAAIAHALATGGFDCLLWGRDRARLSAVGSRWDVVDLRSPDDVRAGIGRLPARLSAVVYAAGLFDRAPADTGDPDVWDELVTVNLAAAMRVTRGVLPALLAAAPSSLVLLGSLDVRDRDVAVTLLSPGLVAAGAGLGAPGVRPEELLQPADVADAVRWVVGTPPHVCPVEVELQPQRSPGTG
ncbi:SDR family oxidoreductase [Blastococcus haudaquaticus]|uniref:NADP-dependent 3-hydroxy acid dehydrogenase YdfG n=1 Tax=Blastococcus haudaquaticus TaxID=1938745 RepID=A0A286H0P9_9ACTN|nr:SDR family NAD(P)-dependent oxidoreductase [Blastococcus haudaquaticus]SOE01337.1 NADP-dependent 3-hydroxy acid dehydrogenase YdfG [Blastococcus haudaquaticus]